MVNEEKKENVETEEEKSSTSNNETGNKPEQNSLIDKANAAAERLERANEIMSKNLKMQEEMAVRDKLGGQSEGAPQKEKPKDVDPSEYADMVLSGKITKEE